MIIRDKNVRGFGYEVPPTVWNASGKKRKTWAKCSWCGSDKIITYYSYLENEKRNGVYICQKCVCNTDAARSQRSVQAKLAWTSTSFRGSQVSRTAALFRSEGHRKLVSERNKKQYRDDPNKYLRDKVAPMHTDEARKRHRQALQKREYRELHRNLALERFKDLKYKEKVAKGIQRFYSLRGRSKPEDAVAKLLGDLGVEFVHEQAVGPYNFDFYLPNFDIYVEVQGEYWHGLSKNSRRDRSKLTYLERSNPGSKVVYIWENELLSTGRALEKIRTGLGLCGSKLIDFRFDEVILRKCSIQESELFLRSYHYAQEGRKPKFVVGACLGINIIAVCKFSPVVRSESATSLGFGTREVFELDRFCISPHRHKKNFASWFLSRCCDLFFEKFESVKALISFADTTYGHVGTIYRASNWKQVSVVKPDYVYVDKDGWMMHKKTLYNHARQCKVTESEYAERHGYGKVFGKKKLKFILMKPGSKEVT